MRTSVGFDAPRAPTASCRTARRVAEHLPHRHQEIVVGAADLPR